MTSLTINLPTDVYQRLEIAATQQGKPAAELAQEWLAEKSTEAVAAISERDRVRAALRAAGLLAEPSPEMQAIAAQSTLTLEEARAILDRTPGKPLSEIILEMRGPKD